MSIPDISIRPETEADYDSIDSINKEAFGGEKEVEIIHSLRRTRFFLKDLSLIAEYQGEAVGHIMFSTISIDQDNICTPTLALGPMSVHPDFQNKGIGTQMIHMGLDRARVCGHGSVLVIGHPNYYPKFGFTPALQWGIRCPWDVPEETFMALELIRGSLDWVNGIATYPDIFEEAMKC